MSSSIAKECPVDKHYNPTIQNCTGIFIKTLITINYTHALKKSKKLTIRLVQYTCMTVQNYSDTIKPELIDLKRIIVKVRVHSSDNFLKYRHISVILSSWYTSYNWKGGSSLGTILFPRVSKHPLNNYTYIHLIVYQDLERHTLNLKVCFRFFVFI